MPATASEAIAAWALRPHPEGGHYREVHRSPVSLGRPPGYSGARCALTVIHFLLGAGEFSALHRVRGEEVWVHAAGDPLELVVLERAARSETLGRPEEGGAPLAVVPAGAWQAARSLGAWTLVHCAVAPGFEFEDFEIARRDRLLELYPEEEDLILRFTHPEALPPGRQEAP